ncbi:formate dehydrogenase accessory sulfurtransferase FdhD [Halobacillus halophilus]|uniref:formate dehydrogenase accessory sulfurtransferase FdhD n=1 Tax=Halobacillus halophilus TaxID=1570 RepID=UPI00136CA1C4|nr:formate dehydrogenase accessory sulfurtransferase FdhD [Halobacillus halophilus]MYL31149.1 formate dehydrogenase accessory sulfurtransferase FdhD [Halobacillus halophilus]
MWTIQRYNEQYGQEEEDVVAVEYPLTIVVNGEEFATMVCTPMDMEDLVIGFLASEGVILTYRELTHLTIDEERGFAYVETSRTVPFVIEGQKRWLGSCCGKSRAFYFQSDAATAKTAVDTTTFSPELCYQLMEAFHKEAGMFKQTGGVHQAAIAGKSGLVKAYTDIGRHNALDKLYGYMLRHQVSSKEKMIIFSGRISSEVLLKVSKMRFGLLLSKSAPTDLSLQLAGDLNITAAGFVRGNRMNVYTHPDRVKEESKGGVMIE